MSREVIDAITATTAVTTPVWIQYMELFLQPFMIAGASLLLLLRIIIAIKELRTKAEDTK